MALDRGLWCKLSGVGENGLKSFQTGDMVIRGIELAEKIKKEQFKMGKLGGCRATLPEIWRTASA